MSHLPEGRLLHEMDLSVRWGDMDALGHVNNIMYLRYFEQIRMEWYESLGFQVLGTERTGMVIVDNHAEYLRPLIYPASVTVRMAGHSPGRSSFVSTYTLSDGETLYTRGSSRMVWIDVPRNKSIPLPDRVRERLEPAAASPSEPS